MSTKSMSTLTTLKSTWCLVPIKQANTTAPSIKHLPITILSRTWTGTSYSKRWTKMARWGTPQWVDRRVDYHHLDKAKAISKMPFKQQKLVSNSLSSIKSKTSLLNYKGGSPQSSSSMSKDLKKVRASSQAAILQAPRQDLERWCKKCQTTLFIKDLLQTAWTLKDQ